MERPLLFAIPWYHGMIMRIYLDGGWATFHKHNGHVACIGNWKVVDDDVQWQNCNYESGTPTGRFFVSDRPHEIDLSNRVIIELGIREILGG